VRVDEARGWLGGRWERTGKHEKSAEAVVVQRETALVVVHTELAGTFGFVKWQLLRIPRNAGGREGGRGRERAYWWRTGTMTFLRRSPRIAICCILGGAGRGFLPFFITLYRRE